MLQFILSRAAFILLSSTLAVLVVACQKNQQPTATGGNELSTLTDQSVAPPATTSAVLPATSQPESVSHSSAIELSYFEQGLDKAVGAFSISQSAQSADDWGLVVSQLQDAVALMNKVPVDSPYFTSAQTKIAEYKRQLKLATQQATRVVPEPSPQELETEVAVVPQTSGGTNMTQPPPAPAPRKLTPAVTKTFKPPKAQASSIPIPVNPIPVQRENEPPVYTALIKRRLGGTPIIEVTFNGDQHFEMILDTGASGTVITQKMALALGVVPVTKAKANTASSKAVEFPIGYVNSIEIDGVRINKVPVAIAGAELETGLLGHDFFGNYDITIKRDVVEFRPQSLSQINSTTEPEVTIPTLPKEPLYIEVPEPR